MLFRLLTNIDRTTVIIIDDDVTTKLPTGNEKEKNYYIKKNC
jgi:hypothetical protein